MGECAASADILWMPIVKRFELLGPIYRSRVAGLGWTESLIAWAVERLVAGQDTPSLRILAGLPESSLRPEVEEYFSAALVELGEAPMSSVERALGGARAVASAILEGAVSPVAGASLAHTIAVSPLNHPRLLQPWCDLDGGFITVEGAKVRVLSGSELEDAIRSFASEFLTADPVHQLQALETELGVDAV